MLEFIVSWGRRALTNGLTSTRSLRKNWFARWGRMKELTYWKRERPGILPGLSDSWPEI